MRNSGKRHRKQNSINHCRSVVFATLFVTLVASGAFSQTGDTLTILHTSDIHIIFDLDRFHPVLAQKRADHLGVIDSLQRFFGSVPHQVKADAVVITGDLLDIFEGETKSHGFLANQVDRFRSLYDKCPVPLYLTLGNHDLTRYGVQEADSSIVQSQTSADRARASWIKNIPCFHDGTYYTRDFQVRRTKYHFIFLDNGYSLHDGGRVIDKAQLDWLQEQVFKAGNEPIVLFFHINFSVGDINGDGISFKEKGPLDWPSTKQCSEGLLKILNENRNIKAMVVGHGHSNVFEGIRFPAGHTIYQIETGSVTEGSMNWRLLQFTEDRIVVSRQGSRKAELNIELK